MGLSIVVRPDDEHNADQFWDALDAAIPAVADSLRERNEAELTAEEWAAVQALPGFGGGPEYAPTALLRVR
jgi:hypothetical protein